jgi:ABC-type transporter Mla maintaining outer membrane lipid asymmetry ATPase subunit MlaF
MASVSRIADKIILIDQQKISWAGKPEEMLKSSNLKIQQFIKAINPILFK